VVGAANTLIRTEGVWEAESTDPEGVVLPVRRLGVALEGAAAAVVGAGGGGRSAVVGLREAGARVTLVNRSEARGREVAEDLDVDFVPLAGFDPRGFAVVVHATTLGRHPEDPLPFDPARLDPDAVVVDLVYGEAETPLLAAVRAAGRRAVDGREVLLYQALEQFRLMTGRELPVPLAREALGLPPEEER
jgi:3-dehydroquinate dehydratase/shikimate dehydrogenase